MTQRLAVLVVLVAAMMAIFGQQFRRPSDPVPSDGDAASDGAAVSLGGIRPGDVMPRLSGRTALTGKDVVISFAGDIPSVLYVLSPVCIWCDRNYENIVALAEGASGRFRFVGISEHAELLPDYLRRHPLPFDVLALDFHDVDLDLLATPQTVSVGRDGVVVNAWLGVMYGRALAYAEHFFGVRLPGLRDPGDLSFVPPATVME